MIRVIIICCVLWGACASFVAAETFARLNAEESGLSESWFGRNELVFSLSEAVPFRVFTLDAPARLIVDFKEVDWRDISSEDLIGDNKLVSDMRFGRFQPGWSRLVAVLSEPVLPREVGMDVHPTTGKAVLTLGLEEVTTGQFAAESGVPKSALWNEKTAAEGLPPLLDDRFVVVIDPGHGGIDPGAEREGVSEKALMLDIALSLRDVLQRDKDLQVVLTRDNDTFVSLDRRVSIAHRASGDLFVSLHADALSQGGARGATVYTLSDEASDTATAHLADRHNRADVLAGVDLSDAGDQVTRVLLDLARQETEPRSKALAHELVASMSAAGGPMNRRPLRQAGFSVLKSADIPSVLVEVGFLSSKRDLENLRDPEWRRGMVDGLAAGILEWRSKDSATRASARQ